jgi:dimethylargininase
MDYSRAIVRKPGRSLVHGITSADLGQPDYQLALAQHAGYVQALEDSGLQVRVLEAQEDYPDSTFLEDVALLTLPGAVILNPGAPTRKGETDGIDRVLGEYYQTLHRVEDPGTVEGGDILQIGKHYYIGLTERTNRAGAEQVIAILERWGLTGSMVPVKNMLHLKTGIAFLDHHLVIANQVLLELEVFQGYPILKVDPEEAYAANCLEINGRVLLPAGFPKTRNLIEDAGYTVRVVEVSEFRKLDGGLSCLSLRF